MALKKAVVVGTDGRLQQLQAGDTLSGASETGQINQTAGAALLAGNAVYTSGVNAINKAAAGASGTKDVLGLTTAAISNAASGQVQTNGFLTLTTTQWDAITGATGGLTANAIYFLSATAGLLTTTVPTTVGQWVAEVGRAISTTDMLIDVRTPILL